MNVTSRNVLQKAKVISVLIKKPAVLLILGSTTMEQ